MADNSEMPKGKGLHIPGRSSLRAQTNIHHGMEKWATLGGADPWPFYARDAREYIDAWSSTFPALEDLPQRLAARKAHGEKVAVADVFGAANAKNIGADHTFSFTLMKHAQMEYGSEHSVVDGDFSRPQDTNKFFKVIDAYGTPLSCAFCFPGSGVEKYGHDMYFLERLYSLLENLYKRLTLDGEMYAYSRFLEPEIKTLPHMLNQISGVEFCKPAELSTKVPHIGCDEKIYLPGFSIVKNEQAPAVLPPFKTIVEQVQRRNAT